MKTIYQVYPRELLGLQGRTWGSGYQLSLQARGGQCNQQWECGFQCRLGFQHRHQQYRRIGNIASRVEPGARVGIQCCRFGSLGITTDTHHTTHKVYPNDSTSTPRRTTRLTHFTRHSSIHPISSTPPNFHPTVANQHLNQFSATPRTATPTTPVSSTMPSSTNDRNAQDIIDLTSSPPAPLTSSTIIPDENQSSEEEEQEDEDLKLAIALSLQDQRDQQDQVVPMTAKPQRVDVPSSTEKAQEGPDGAMRSTATATQTTGNGIFGIDRKTMEIERLARLKRKRARSDDDGDAAEGTSRPSAVRGAHGIELESESRTGSTRISPPPLRRTTITIPPTTATTVVRSTSSLSQRTSPFKTATYSSTREIEIYPHGKILKTYVEGYSAGNTITFSSLIAPSQSLKSCLLSSFIWDFDWLFPHFKYHTYAILPGHACEISESERADRSGFQRDS